MMWPVIFTAFGFIISQKQRNNMFDVVPIRLIICIIFVEQRYIRSYALNWEDTAWWNKKNSINQEKARIKVRH